MSLPISPVRFGADLRVQNWFGPARKLKRDITTDPAFQVLMDPDITPGVTVTLWNQGNAWDPGVWVEKTALGSKQAWEFLYPHSGMVAKLKSALLGNVQPKNLINRLTQEAGVSYTIPREPKPVFPKDILPPFFEWAASADLNTEKPGVKLLREFCDLWAKRQDEAKQIGQNTN